MFILLSFIKIVKLWRHVLIVWEQVVDWVSVQVYMNQVAVYFPSANAIETLMEMLVADFLSCCINDPHLGFDHYNSEIQSINLRTENPFVYWNYGFWWDLLSGRLVVYMVWIKKWFFSYCLNWTMVKEESKRWNNF